MILNIGFKYKNNNNNNWYIEHIKNIYNNCSLPAKVGGASPFTSWIFLCCVCLAVFFALFRPILSKNYLISIAFILLIL